MAEVKEAQQQDVILVTGGSGLVGQALQSLVATEGKANEKWVFLSSKDADLRLYEETKKVFDAHKPTHVIHLAAYVGGLFRNMAEPVNFWHYNTAINENVIKCCFEHKVQKLVNCLSTCIFPDSTKFPLDESSIHSGAPHSSNEPYAYSKRMLDVISRAYHRQYGCQYTSVVPTNLYGPHDNFNLQDGHVVAGLVHKVYLAKKNGTPLTCWGTGRPLRQFVFAKDVARFFLWALREYDDVSPIVLAPDEADEVSIKELVEAVVEAMGFTGEVVWDDTKSDGQYKKTVANTKMRKLLPSFKFTPIKEGVKETVDWLVANYETARK